MEIKDKQAVAVSVASKRKTRLFKVLAALMPFVILLLTELLLTLFQYGNDYTLFLESPDHPGFFQMNQKIGEKYFSQQANATIGDHELFKINKDSNDYRIFVLGASSAIGYPYLHNGSFHRWLKYRLMHTFPQKNFEIINLSLTAVNSNTLYDFSRQLVNYKPDAVLIYEGHNEYYGALGVASTSNIGRNPLVVRLVIRLREFRVIQLFTNIYIRLRHFFSSSKVDINENLMKRMVAEQDVPYGSTLFTSGLHQFEVNLHDMLRVFEQNHVPVFIGTLVSNEKDLPPFISLQTDSTHAVTFRGAFHEAILAMDHRDTAKAWPLFLKAQQYDSGYAMCSYYLGRIAWAKGEYLHSKNYLVRAKELDALRFRAPSAVNDIIRREVASFPNTHLVNVLDNFESHSPHGIIGSETILEHLHPNLYGYALLSDAFFKSMQVNKMIRDHWASPMSFDTLLNQMPVTRVDSLHGVYEIMMLKEGWPFNEPMPSKQKAPKNIDEQLAGAFAVRQINWSTAMNSLLNYYLKEKDFEQALTVSKAFQLEYPYEAQFYLQCGDLCMKLGRYPEAVFYFSKGFQLSNNFECARKLVIIYLKIDEPLNALPYFNYLKMNNLSGVNFGDLEIMVNEVIRLKQQYQIDSTNCRLANAIAAAYLKFANAEAAEVYVNKSRRLKPGNTEAMALQDEIKKIKSEK